MAEATSTSGGGRRVRAIREMPAAERPRERLAARGPAGLSAAELIALVWGSGSAGRSAVDLAEDALSRHDGLTGLARATDIELESVPGIGEAKAAQLTAAFELGRRLLADWPSTRWTVRSPRDVADRLVLQMGRLEREELRVVLLNTKNVVLRMATVYQGNVSTSLVRIGELFRDAVRLNAAGIIVVHNHPSGDPSPLRRMVLLIHPPSEGGRGRAEACQPTCHPSYRDCPSMGWTFQGSPSGRGQR
jgi:DNA repair protein RadC